jgi:uncharacterized protein YkwD
MPKQTTKTARKTQAPSAIPKKPLHKHIAHHTKKLLIPGEHNDFRPHLIRRQGLIALLFLVIAVQFLYNLSAGHILGAQSNITSATLLKKTNEERTKHNEQPLALNDNLTKAAELKAKNMFENQYWAHTAPDGTEPWKWIDDANYDYSEAGENLARGFTNADSILAAWLDSPTHRDNILHANYSEVGFAAVDGVLNGKTTTLVVALYAKPATGSVLAAHETYLSRVETNETLFEKLKRGLTNLTPSLVFILILLGIAAAASILAHAYRKQLPTNLKKSWYRHHGLYKIAFITVLALGAIMSYGNGLI